MSIQQRLRRLEAMEGEVRLREYARWLAEQHGSNVEEELANLQAIHERITRHGIEAEIRQMARESGKSEDEMRARIEAISDELAEVLP